MELQVSEDVAPHFEFCLQMECAAAAAYLRFVYDDWETAVAVERFLGEKGLLESSPPFGRVLVRAGEPIGMVSGVPGPALRTLRMKSALALRAHPTLAPDEATQRRMQLAHGVLLAPEATDFYSSKLGVSPAARGTGAGPKLMSFITEEGRNRGFARVVGEVAPENAAMMRVMVDKVGWDRLDEKRVEDPETGRTLAYAHLGKAFRVGR